MKTVSKFAAAIIALGVVAAPAVTSAAPIFVTGAPYDQKVDPQNLRAIQNQPTPKDPMIPGSSESDHLYDSQIRNVVAATGMTSFHHAAQADR